MEQFLAGVTNRLAQTFDPAAAGARVAELLENLVIGLSVYVAYYLVWRALALALPTLFRQTNLDETAAIFTRTVLKYGILIVGLVHALDSIGINTAGILTSLGIAGLTIGFAARDALSNIISGILIFWDRPFVIGDLVEIGGQYGRVDRITLRSTRVVTVDGRMLAVPNTSVINTTVVSYTNFPHLRLDITVSVGLEEDLDRVRELMLACVRGDEAFDPAPEPRVVVSTLGTFSNDVQLQAWLTDERDHVARRFALREKVYRTLLSAGVDMPFETLVVKANTRPERDAA